MLSALLIYLINNRYSCQLLSSDKCIIPGRIEIIDEKEREREIGQFLPQDVEEQVENTSSNVRIRRA
jgi:hypothetical protein